MCPTILGFFSLFGFFDIFYFSGLYFIKDLLMDKKVSKLRKPTDFVRFVFTAHQFYSDPSIPRAVKSVLRKLEVRGNSQKKIGAEQIGSFRYLAGQKIKKIPKNGSHKKKKAHFINERV